MDQDSAGPLTGTPTSPTGNHDTGHASDGTGDGIAGGSIAGIAGGHPLALLLAHLEADLKVARDVDPMYLPAEDRATLLLRLGTLTDQLAAVQLKVVSCSEDVARADGHKSVAAWLAARRHTSYGEEAGAMRLAEALEDRWQTLGQALADGAANLAQAKVIARVLDDLHQALTDTESEADGPLTIAHPDHPHDPTMRVIVTTEQLMAMAEEALVEHCQDLGPTDLRTVGEQILTTICPQVADEAERRALERAERRASTATTLTIRNRGDGSADLRGRISEQAASRLRTILAGYTAPRHDAMTRARASDGASDGAHGSDHGDSQDGRDAATGTRLSHDRRLGHAFEAFLEHTDPARLPTQGGSPTKLVITLRLSDLVTGLGTALLPDGTRITASQALRLACEADLVPAVLNTDGEVLHLGRASRLFSAAQKLARQTQLRLSGHTTCQAHGCTTPLEHCEAHHRRKTWAQGGTTDLEDLDFLCPWHHHRVHDPDYTHQRHPDGTYRFHRRT